MVFIFGVSCFEGVVGLFGVMVEWLIVFGLCMIFIELYMVEDVVLLVFVVIVYCVVRCFVIFVDMVIGYGVLGCLIVCIVVVFG